MIERTETCDRSDLTPTPEELPAYIVGDIVGTRPPAPSWSEQNPMHGLDAIGHQRLIGSAPVIPTGRDGDSDVQVWVECTESFDPDGTIRRTRPAVVLRGGDDATMTANGARELADLISVAADMIETAEADR